MTDQVTAASNATTDAAPVNDALQPAAPEEQGYKVFVGNLSFQTKEEKLKEVFGEHGALTDAQIILRGARSLGYGFVTFTSQDDAQKAVAALDKVAIDGRNVNVEIAKPQADTPGGSRAAAKGVKKASATAATDTAAADAAAAAAAEGREEGEARIDEAAPPNGAAPKKRSAPRKKKVRARAVVNADADAEPEPEATAGLGADAAVEQGAVPASGPAEGKKRQRRNKKKPAAAGGTSDENANEGEHAAPNGAAPRPKREKKRGPPLGEPSKTLLFVSNLPFGLDDEGLKGVFEGFQVASAHVVKRRYGPAAGRSKGFGFVDLESEEEQQKALAEVHGKDVDGRAVLVKVAVGGAKAKSEGEQELPNSSAEAAAPETAA